MIYHALERVALAKSDYFIFRPGFYNDRPAGIPVSLSPKLQALGDVGSCHSRAR